MFSKMAAKLEKGLTRTEVAEEKMRHALVNSRVTKPPRGKVMLKQLFAGQTGLTYMSAMYLSWACGRPLDLAYGWDAASRKGIVQLNNDMEHEDPYCTVVMHPCGPWSK